MRRWIRSVYGGLGMLAGMTIIGRGIADGGTFLYDAIGLLLAAYGLLQLRRSRSG